MNNILEKQAVSPVDQMVFCPLRYREVPIGLCIECDRLIRADDHDPPRYIICDARMLDRRDRDRGPVHGSR